MQNLEEAIFNEVMAGQPKAGPQQARSKVVPIRVKAQNELFDDVFNEVSTHASGLTKTVGHLFGLFLWTTLWAVGAYSTVVFAEYIFPWLKNNPVELGIWLICVGISFYERAEMPPFQLIWQAPWNDGYFTNAVPVFFKMCLNRKMFWAVLGLDVGATFGGIYVFLIGKQIPFFIWILDFRITALLIAASIIIALVCAVGPEPGIKKHWKIISKRK